MSPDQTAPVPAGWYPDPYGMSEMRWWDGQNWTESVHPALASPSVAGQPATPVATPAMQTVAEPVAQSVNAPLAEPVVSENPPHVIPNFAPPQSETLLTSFDAGIEPHSQSEVVEHASSAANFSAESLDRPQPEVAPESQIASTPVAPLVASSAEPLPSRRELRLRNELVGESEAPNSVSAFSELGLTALTDLGGESQFSDVAKEPTNTPMDSATIVTAEPSVTPSSVSRGVPDSSTPTAFDWLSSSSTGGIDPVTSTPPPLVEPDAPAVSAAQPNLVEGGFPPLGTPVVHPTDMNTGVGGYSDPPVGVTDAWTRETTIIASPDDSIRPTATRKTTVTGWFIAAMPLIAAVLSIAVVKGKENYPRYLPVDLEWWMLALGVIGVLYLVTLLLAVADSRKLDWAGYNQPPRWTWALLGAPVYLAVRTLAVKRETGRVSIMLWVWIALTLIVVGAWFAAGSLAPELIANYSLPLG